MEHTFTPREIIKGVGLAVAAAIALSAATHAGQADAGMEGVLQGMFAATEAPMVAQTNNGYTLSGGYAVYHTPMSGANVISFSPPNISAGCGGINLYMGSFHFINGQQFMALLRTVGQEALGYAFELAIQAMCHQCGALLSAIQKAISDMNNALRNTCQLAQGVFPGNQILQDFQTVGNEAEKTMGNLSGDVTDFFSASNNATHEGVLSNLLTTYKHNLAQSFSFLNPNGTTSTVTQQKSVSQAAATPTGNMFWKGINNTEAENMLANLVNSQYNLDASNPCKAAGDHACTKELLMSLVGTTIIRPSASSQGNNNAAAEGEGSTASGAVGPAVNQANGKNTINQPPTLNFLDLVNGTQNAPVLQCQSWTDANGTNYGAFSPNMGCEWMTANATLGGLGFEGISKHIHNMIEGGGPGNHKGLIYYMTTGTPLSANQKAFLNTVPAPIYALMMQASGTPLVPVIGQRTEPLVSEIYAAELGQAVYSVAQSVYAGNAHVIIPENYQSVMNNLSADVRMYQKEYATNYTPIVNGLTKMVQNYRASLVQGMRVSE